MQSPALVDRIVEFARAALPLLEWGWAAIDDDAPAPLPIRIPAPSFAETRLLGSASDGCLFHM